MLVFNHVPRVSHLNAVKEFSSISKALLRWDFGMMWIYDADFAGIGTIDLLGYMIHWLSNLAKKYFGTCYFLGNWLVSWSSKKYSIVTLFGEGRICCRLELLCATSLDETKTGKFWFQFQNYSNILQQY